MKTVLPAATDRLPQPPWCTHDEAARTLVEGICRFDSATYHQGNGPSPVMRAMAMAASAALRDLMDRGELTADGRQYAQRYAAWFDAQAVLHTAPSRMPGC